MQNWRETFGALPLKGKKEWLSQYRRLIKEIEADRLRLAQLAGRLLRYNPAGLPAGAAFGAFPAYEARIGENLARCERLAAELQSFINEIEDSITRRVFTLRYINGLTWQSVATHIHNHDESYPRKLHDRYLEKYGRAG